MPIASGTAARSGFLTERAAAQGGLVASIPKHLRGRLVVGYVREDPSDWGYTWRWAANDWEWLHATRCFMGNRWHDWVEEEQEWKTIP